MKRPHEFRRHLVLRLIAVVVATAPFAGIAGIGANSLSSCVCPEEEVIGENCFTWPLEGSEDGGLGGSGNSSSGGMGGSGGGGGGNNVPAFPSKDEAKATFDGQPYSGRILEVLSEPTQKEGACCYNMRYIPECIGGRPFVVDEQMVVAPLVYGASRGNGFSGATEAPDASALEFTDRAALAAAWARDGQFEHASIASFGRFALSLLALGAPADLIADAHRAALDEVHHARLCFDLASAYAGENIGPGAFPFAGRVDIVEDLAEFAVRTVEEGCIGETMAACVAAEQLTGATDPAVRRALEIIIADESRHAELAFRTVAWAISTGGAHVRAAVARASAGATLSMTALNEMDNNDLSAHGRLTANAEQAAKRRAFEDVVRPALRSLLDASSEALPHVAALPS